MASWEINKGVGRTVEFKGLKANKVCKVFKEKKVKRESLEKKERREIQATRISPQNLTN